MKRFISVATIALSILSAASMADDGDANSVNGQILAALKSIDADVRAETAVVQKLNADLNAHEHLQVVFVNLPQGFSVGPDPNTPQFFPNDPHGSVELFCRSIGGVDYVHFPRDLPPDRGAIPPGQVGCIFKVSG